MIEPEATGAVFVPGLMGAGILLSAALLLADSVRSFRRLSPNSGARRKVLVVRGVRALVADAARAAGLDISRSKLFRRELRSRWTYLSLGTVLGALAGLSVRLGTDAYFGIGRFQGNYWPLGAGLIAGAVLGVGALLGFVLAARGDRVPKPIERVVASTWLGRLRAPPDDPRERARLLVSELSGDEMKEGVERG